MSPDSHDDIAVVCAACGTRIKADRDFCLRCGAPLVAARSQHLRLPAWVQAHGGSTLIFGAVGALVVGVLAAALWQGTEKVDTNARPAPGAALRRSAEPNRTARKAPAPDFAEPRTGHEETRSGEVAFQDGDFAAARARFEQALQKNPNDTEALNGLGLTLERAGAIDDAIARYTRAAALAPDKWAYHFNLAHAVGLKGQWDDAVAQYRTAATLFPTDYATAFNLANALHKKGDDEGAIPEFEKAIQLAPSEATFHISLAVSLEKVGRAAEAQREFQQYLDMDPSGPQAEQVRAHLQAMSTSSAPSVPTPAPPQPTS